MVPLKKGDLDMLARVAYGEARGEGYTGMLAVVHVILNRSRQPKRYGTTLQLVCKRPWQFSCLNPGDPNRERLLKVDESDPQFVMAMLAALNAVTNEDPDPTGRATHYYATWMREPPDWAAKLTPTASIGQHLFFRE